MKYCYFQLKAQEQGHFKFYGNTKIKCISSTSTKIGLIKSKITQTNAFSIYFRYLFIVQKFNLKKKLNKRARMRERERESEREIFHFDFYLL